ncbi:MAG: aldo/keto reductase [Gemmatimonadota bacterium]
MLNRRDFLGITAGAGASLAFTPALLRALQQPSSTLIQRAIPSTGEMLPVIGLQFGNSPPFDQLALKEVLKTFAENGGRLLDSVHQSAPGAEDVTATITTELGLQSKMFLVTRGSPIGPPQPGPEAAKAQVEQSLAKFKVPKLDLVMVNPVNVGATHLPRLKEEKGAGRIRYIGAQVINDAQYPQLAAVMRDEPIDFIGIDYALDNRDAEETILPLALERKIGVIAYFTFGAGATGGLFRRVASTPLPAWAADFDAKSWAQFFLKYVISHPAVTVARVGTSKASHMLDDLGGGIGRLPDEPTRKRMAAFIDALPVPVPQNPAAAPGLSLPAAVLERYASEWTLPSGAVVTFRRDQDRLVVKAGTNPDMPLNARSTTRFQDPRGPFFEFQLDAQGNVTGAVLEQGGPQGVQRVVLQRK